MLQRLVRASSKKWNSRLFSSSAVRNPRPEDEGDWFYSSEWWGKDPESDGHTVLRSTSDKGNGVVSVVAYPSSRPDAVEWKGMEKWLQKRYQKIQPENELNDPFRILGYQWRVLHFNDVTIQSAVKIMAAYRKSDPSSVFIMQQPDILAVPYVKSMATVGLTTLASCGYDLLSSAHRGKPMHILCIGHGAGSLPLFLASKIQGAIVHVVEIDPVVISASVQAMGFPAFSVMTPSGERVHTRPEMMDELLWKGTHERLFLYESDAEKFIINNTHLYDLIYIDAYDGDDIFPRKFWDTNSPFLEALKDRLHPEHGTVVVNLHSDHDNVYEDGNSPPSLFHQFVPMGRYVSQVGRAYKDGLVWNGIDFDGQGLGGLGFIVSVPWLCNTSLVVCRGFGLCVGNPDRDLVLNKLMTKSQEVEGAIVHVVEIDPVVISASVQAMGFPAFSVMTPSGERVHTRPEMMDELLWKGTHERLFLYEPIINNTHLYDLIYIDAYDGDDIFPRKLWDTNSPFLEALKDRLHPEHGTVVVNLHSDHDNVYEDGNSPPSLFHQFVPMGRYVSQVGRAYKDGLVWNGIDFDGHGLGGLGFIVSVPWLCNTSLVVCRGFGLCGGNPDRDLVLNKLMTKSQEVEGILNLPFSCLQYLKRGFLLVD